MKARWLCAADPYALGGPPQAPGGPPRGSRTGEPTPSGAPQQAPDANQDAYVTGEMLYSVKSVYVTKLWFADIL